MPDLITETNYDELMDKFKNEKSSEITLIMKIPLLINKNMNLNKASIVLTWDDIEYTSYYKPHEKKGEQSHA